MRTVWNDGWMFCKLALDGDERGLSPEKWQPVSLPHDWLIGQENNLYENGKGLYKKTFSVAEDQLQSTWELCFDGVYMDCDVEINGQTVCTHRYGYTAFRAECGAYLHPGENTVLVRVRYQSPNTRWYSGAGIFRDVTLCVLPRAHLTGDGLYAVLRPAEEGWWSVRVRAQTAQAEGCPVAFALTDREGTLVASGEGLSRGGEAQVEWRVENPMLWSCETPHLYTLQVRLGEDSIQTRVGFRETAFDPDRGFLLNGKQVKLHGVCLHHDLGLLGSAFHRKAARRQLRLMRQMGVNALRTSHNPPAAGMLDLCDEMGILVVDELLDMWRMPKTACDYARFFDDCIRQDVAAWIRRDRNHPCVILWSIGNEIYDTHADPQAPQLTAMLKAWVEEHDPCRNARATIGSNYMPWEGAQRCADVLKIAGYNYGEKLYAQHHREHPDWVIYGSETGSLLASRGVYHFPMAQKIMSEEDLQCSALGNSNTSWGADNIGRMLAEDRTNSFSMGQFIWSGIDYIGEPTPYHTRCCYFGQADTACFPKDSYYHYQAAWTQQPVLHIGVIWDWNEGQLIDVPVMTNAPEAELFLNGQSLGRKAVDLCDPDKNLPVWQVPFQAGVLMARSYGADGQMLQETRRVTPGEPVRLRLSAEEACLRADGQDLAFVTVWAEDDQGRPVENACNRVTVRVEGPASLMGLDNGDSTDTDGYRQNSRCLFGGKLLAVIGCCSQPGEVRLTASAPDLQDACLTLPCVAAEQVFAALPPRLRAVEPGQEPLARRIDLRPLGSTHLTPQNPAVDFAVQVLPAAAAGQPLAFRVVNEMGITSPVAQAETIPGGVRVTGCGDGHVYLRATARNGAPQARVLSQMEITLEGFGTRDLDPYGFVTAGLYDLREGDIGSGNEQGVAFARDGYSMVGYSHVDFGAAGSDTITIPIFALNDAKYEITLWQGDPRQKGEKLAVLTYQKPSVWNTYQEETWRLPRRLKGVQTLCFSMHEKVHMRGFSFAKQSRAWQRLSALEADAVYGDAFERTDRGVEKIGNNVSLIYRGMDFGAGGRAVLTLWGATPLAACAVNVRFVDRDGDAVVRQCMFAGQGGEAQCFPMEVPGGLREVALVFLPGAQMDLFALAFSREETK